MIAACAPATRNGAQPGGGEGAARSQADRTLVVAVRLEPTTLAQRAIQGAAFAAAAVVRRPFNADLAIIDGSGHPRPYISQALPELHTDTWRVFPDGQMETTWTIKPGLVWHDGVAFSAQDIVFAWRVYKLPEYGGAASRSMRAIQDVSAPDDRTLVIHWRQLYPNANDLTSDGLPPLPRHVLEPSFQQVDAETFANDSFWTRQFIGLGPYRLDQWEPGSFLEGTAFDQQALGRPKINRVRILFIPDPNTALAHALAGELDFIGDNAIVTEQAYRLEQEWKRTGAGSVINTPNLWRFTTFQLRPELADPRALLDVRVRKALAYSVDRESLSENIYHGENAVADFLVSPQSQWGAALPGAVQSYPYDLQRTEQLMNEAGFAKGADGTFATPAGGRFAGELKTTVEREDEVTVMSSDWRKAGFDIHQAVLAAALSTDPASRATFPAMFTSTTPQGAFDSFTTAQAPRADNNWRGGPNRGGWSNLEYDRLVDAFATTLEPSERAAEVAQMARIFTEELPMLSLFFLSVPYAYVSGLKGPAVVAPETWPVWNLPDWELS